MTTEHIVERRGQNIGHQIECNNCSAYKSFTDHELEQPEERKITCQIRTAGYTRMSVEEKYARGSKSLSTKIVEGAECGVIEG